MWDQGLDYSAPRICAGSQDQDLAFVQCLQRKHQDSQKVHGIALKALKLSAS